MPDDRPSRARVEQALAEILAWPGLARSPQLAKFLKYVVEAELRGDEASIKAYSIAVDVFGRPSTFDPQSDPIVRVQAGRLRAALDEYYRSEGASSDVRFVLPVGRYVPVVEAQTPTQAAPDLAETELAVAEMPAAKPRIIRANRKQLIGALGIAALLAIVVLGLLFPFRIAAPGAPKIPTIAVAEFAGFADPGLNAPSVAGLAVELVTDLEQFDDLQPIYVQKGAVEEGGDAAFQLTGIGRATGTDVQVTGSVRRSNSDAVVWTETVTVPVGKLQESIDDISQRFSEQLGSHRGSIHADAMRWLDQHQGIDGSESEYICDLLFTRYRDRAQISDAARARACVSAMLRATPDSAEMLSLRAALLFDDTVATQPPGQLDPEPMAEVRRLHERAISLVPTSSRVWELYADYLAVAQRNGEAEAAFRSALQLNPANLDAEAGYGRLLLLRGASERGAELAAAAIRRETSPPPWYFAGPAVAALRHGDDALAMEYADRLVAGDAELGTVVATVAGYRSKSEDVLNRYFAQLLDVTRFRRFGILPVLRSRIADTALVFEIAKVLTDAGVAPAALAGRF